MPDQTHSESDKEDGDATPPPALTDGEPHSCCPENPKPSRCNQESTEDNTAPSPKPCWERIQLMWGRIRLIDVVNCLVGIATLVVAFDAYRIATDSSDIKSAIQNIYEVAVQTKRQADALNSQFDQLRRQADNSSTQLRLAFPAKLKLQNIVIRDSADGREPEKFIPGHMIEGEAYFINVGHDAAHDAWGPWCLYWHSGPLPMLRPYIHEPKECDDSSKNIIPKWLDGSQKIKINGEPGYALRFRFSTKVPLDYVSGTDLYFMGSLIFTDAFETTRFVLFAKKFDSERGHFVAVDNPDYNNEDAD
jgi:hypothetical protein